MANSPVTYAEAHKKLEKELTAATNDGMPYVILPVDIAQRLNELCIEKRNEDQAKVPR